MKQLLGVLEMLVSLALIALILIQAKGTGLGRTFGSGGGTSFSRRGLEKIIFKLTFIVAGLFLVLAVLQLLF